ncbi:YceD family protein [Corynebacterium pilosum]|uniref:Metal-binding, possibly nucleic acid-binding protein n=1 Tax=Corynebacterium pilosum TaxID=35756 RepID=A0A376CI99_9CORY|nr:YceD family protein [Corynebacterium pilosum]STC68216.1 metal-binding, possibly nucleic acid-binding protein [Corynebacterium pilosum]
MANNPFVLNVADALRSDGMPLDITATGPSPSRIGPEMIAIPEGGEVTVEATVTNLGSGVLVDATATAQLEGECVRCLAPLTPTETLSISQVFSTDDDFISGDAEDDEDKGSGDEVKYVAPDDTVDLEQAFVDEAGLSLPFNPTCQPSCAETDVPEPDGVSGEVERVDPRWAGLEKFL